jgi:hypothetical protein
MALKKYKKYLIDLDLSRNQLKNAVIHNITTSSLPVSPKIGMFYYDSTEKKLTYWNGSNWIYLTDVPNIDLSLYVKKDGTTVMTGDLQMGTGGTDLHSIVNVKDPTNQQDATTKKYVDDELGNLVNTFVAGNQSQVGNVPKFKTSNGLEIEDSGFYLEKSVPASANFNDTTYSVASGGTPGLTEVNFSSALYTKLDGIEANAQRNVKPDWNAGVNDAGVILNKPTKLSEFTDDVVSGNYYPMNSTVADSSKLGGTPASDYALKADSVQVDGSSTMTGDLDLGSKKIVNVATPVSPSDAANKNYVDSAVTGGMNFKGGYDAAADVPALLAGTVNVTKGDMYTVTTDSPSGTPFCTYQLKVGDSLIASADIPSGSPDCSKWTVVQNNLSNATEAAPGIIEIATQSETDVRTDDARAITPAKLAGNLHFRNILKYQEASIPGGGTSQSISLDGRPVSINIFDGANVCYEMEIERTSTGVNITSNDPIPNGLTLVASVIVEL